MEWIWRWFLVWYAVGVILVGFDLLPPFLEWANAVFLYLAGGLAVIYAVKTLGIKTGLTFSVLIMAFTMWAESLGVKYGWVFGAYHYEKDFGIQIFGVPLTIGFAWVMVIFTAMGIFRRFLKKPFSVWRGLLYAFSTALLAVCMDLIIDPVAFVVKQYWIWENTGPYYGIPNQNFIGWFSVSFGIQLILYCWIAWRGAEENTVWQKRMVLLYFMMIGMFVVTSIVAGLWGAVATTLLSLIVPLSIYWIWRKGDEKHAAI